MFWGAKSHLGADFDVLFFLQNLTKYTPILKIGPFVDRVRVSVITLEPLSPGRGNVIVVLIQSETRTGRWLIPAMGGALDAGRNSQSPIVNAEVLPSILVVSLGRSSVG